MRFDQQIHNIIWQCGILSFILGLGSCSMNPFKKYDKTPTAAVEALIELLADPATTEKQKPDIENSFIDHGVNAIPVLINHLNDQRVADKRMRVPGIFYNQPAFEALSEKPSPKSSELPGAEELLKESEVEITVGKRCEELLYAILEGNYLYASPYAPPSAGRSKIPFAIDHAFVINDWTAWWKKHKNKNLDELHGESKKRIDEFWRRGWDKGPLEWK